MRVAILGAGLVGRRTAELLADDPRFDLALLSHDRPVESMQPIPNVKLGRGWPNAIADEPDIVVLATASRVQPTIARQLVRAGCHVISTADDPDAIDRLLSLDPIAVERGSTVVAGAAYSPGVSTVLAAYLASQLTEVSTITTAQFGTGGPTCARQHHRAMSTAALEVHDRRLRVARSGTGRELVWFPEPIGAADCYRAGLAEPVLLYRTFPDVDRIESRQAATRRDRLTARLPMMRPPHPEGLIGAVHVEVRGRIDGRVEHRAMAATAPQAWGAAAMAAALCREMAERDDSNQQIKGGVQSAAQFGNLVSLLQHVSNGVRLWTYDGSRIEVQGGEPGPIQAARKWRIPGETA